jgi:hypothetical protein
LSSQTSSRRPFFVSTARVLNVPLQDTMPPTSTSRFAVIVAV